MSTFVTVGWFLVNLKQLGQEGEQHNTKQQKKPQLSHLDPPR